jgi:hypothetical protein
MKTKILIITTLSGLMIFGSCKKPLDYTPKGLLSASDLTSPTAADGLVTAAYAAIGNGDMIGPIYSKWAFGSVRSDDAYKGGGGTGDVGEIDAMEHYNLVTPSIDAFVSRTWKNLFKSISRANVALRAINAFSDAQFPNKKERIAELRFLRAHYTGIYRNLMRMQQLLIYLKRLIRCLMRIHGTKLRMIFNSL